jgi:GTP cyclohydrolase II
MQYRSAVAVPLDAVKGSPAGAPRIRTVAQLPIELRDGRQVRAEIVSFDGLRDGKEHFALKLGNPSPDAPLVRLHSECMTGDVFGSARCDCGPQLQEALSLMDERGGYLLYLRQEGRGIGLYRKLEAYRLQEEGHDTYAANRALGHHDDERNYGVAVDMLNALGIKRIVLLSNNPDKRKQLEAAGIAVASMEPTGVFVGAHNRRYLEAKVRHTGHAIDLGAENLQHPDASTTASNDG